MEWRILKFQKNTIYGCRVVKIDGIDETYTTKITIKDDERSCYNLIKDKEKVIIAIK